MGAFDFLMQGLMTAAEPMMLLYALIGVLIFWLCFIVIDKIAKSIFRVPGVSRVQAITRPLGTPIEHTSIPFLMSMSGTSQKMNEKYAQDSMANMLKQANDMQINIDTMKKMQGITTQMAATTHSMVAKMVNMTLDVADLRDHISDFDDFFRPIRNYFYWEPHCYDIPICHALRSIFDALDGIDTLSDDLQSIVVDMDRLDVLMPKMVQIMPPGAAGRKRASPHGSPLKARSEAVPARPVAAVRPWQCRSGSTMAD